MFGPCSSNTTRNVVTVHVQVEYMEKGTMTGLALKHMLENSFSEAEGARPLSRNIPRIGLVFTDGRSQDDITEYAKKAKEAGKTQDDNNSICSSVSESSSAAVIV